MWKAYGRNNSIYNNNTDAISRNSSVFYAECNWWGTDGAQIYKDASSTLDVAYPLSSDPWNQSPSPGESEINPISINNNSPNDVYSFSPDSSVLLGVYLETQERILEAIQHFKQMISNNIHQGFAVRRLVVIKNRYNIQNIRDYLENLIPGNRPYKPIVLTLFSSILLGEDKYEQAMFLLSKIINDYPGTYYAVNALFEELFAALNYANNRELAEQLLQELIALVLNDEEYLIRLQIAQNLFNESSFGNFAKTSSTNSENTEADLPKEYNLLGNYPNPFNPITTISYTLPYQSSVELIIYDIMGREVKTFTITSQTAGYQNIIWDGTNVNGNSVASGVYLYRIKIKSLENQNEFVKTSKLMLLK
jgi:tetratricopeptide (TPR) repeat protein